MYPRYKKALIAALTASGVSPEAADDQADQILSTLQGDSTMNAPKTKAAVVAAAQCLSTCSSEHMFSVYQNSPKAQGQNQKSPPNHKSARFSLACTRTHTARAKHFPIP